MPARKDSKHFFPAIFMAFCIFASPSLAHGAIPAEERAALLDHLWSGVGFGLDIRDNCLFSTDEMVRMFLDMAQTGGNWEISQCLSLQLCTDTDSDGFCGAALYGPDSDCDDDWDGASTASIPGASALLCVHKTTDCAPSEPLTQFLPPRPFSKHSC